MLILAPISSVTKFVNKQNFHCKISFDSSSVDAMRYINEMFFVSLEQMCTAQKFSASRFF